MRRIEFENQDLSSQVFHLMPYWESVASQSGVQESVRENVSTGSDE